MSILLKTVYSMLTGAIGALVAWHILDVWLKLQPSSPFADALVNGALVGACIGVAVNSFAGLLEFKAWPIIKGFGVGLAAGLLGGSTGLLAGEALYQFLGHSAALRITGWAIFGVSLGLADGVFSHCTAAVAASRTSGLSLLSWTACCTAAISSA